jgi:acetyl esterase/lipase
MSKLILLAVATMLGMAALAHAQPLNDRQNYNLWPGQAPGQQGDDPADIPVVQAFVPENGKATGASFVVCPGGGYAHLAAHEGPKVGEWFAKNGVTAFVLRYRLGPKYHHPVEMEDAQRAMRFVRAHAKEWKLDPDRIGIMGFSAGGLAFPTNGGHSQQPGMMMPGH